LLAAPAWAAERAVSMTGNAYEPARVPAAVRDTLRFVNRDAVDHNVFVPTVGHAVDLGKQGPGQETVLGLGKPGLLDIECVFHLDMVMAVEVRP
jgi:plastocyanin